MPRRRRGGKRRRQTWRPSEKAEDSSAKIKPAAPLAPSPQPLTLIVQGLAGEICRITADASWRVLQVKQGISEKTGIPMCTQRLMCGVSLLDDEDNTLAAAASLFDRPADVEGAPPLVDLTLLRLPAKEALGWQLAQNSLTSVLREVNSGLILELIGESNGWYRIADETGHGMIVYSDDWVEDRELADFTVELARQAAGHPPEQLPEQLLEKLLEGPGSIKIGAWRLEPAEDRHGLSMSITHSTDGTVLHLGPRSLVTPRRPAPESPAQVLFQRLLAVSS